MEFGDLLIEAAEAAARQSRKALRSRRKAVNATRRPGPESPLWNYLVRELQNELVPLGSKVRLARYLGAEQERGGIGQCVDRRSRRGAGPQVRTVEGPRVMGAAELHLPQRDVPCVTSAVMSMGGAQLYER